jgi:glycosyltransferase involved in cell wall biosynthesis
VSAYRASILLAARDQAPLLLRCLTAVGRLGDDAGFEAVVVDDGSADETAQLLAAIDGDFQALAEPESIGWGRAIDRAAAVARGEHLVFLREDAVPADGWFDRLLAALEADPQAGAVRAAEFGLDGARRNGDGFACLAVRRAAFAAVGGVTGAARLGRAEQASFLAAVGDAGWAVRDADDAVVLVLPDDR